MLSCGKARRSFQNVTFLWVHKTSKGQKKKYKNCLSKMLPFLPLIVEGGNAKRVLSWRLTWHCLDHYWWDWSMYLSACSLMLLLSFKISIPRPRGITRMPTFAFNLKAEPTEVLIDWVDGNKERKALHKQVISQRQEVFVTLSRAVPNCARSC